ncbi:MAG: hypothetical protein K5873_08085 [Treponema sp.]|nr:hypothetical protein [Treponema sp.]
MEKLSEALLELYIYLTHQGILSIDPNLNSESKKLKALLSQIPEDSINAFQKTIEFFEDLHDSASINLFMKNFSSSHENINIFFEYVARWMIKASYKLRWWNLTYFKILAFIEARKLKKALRHAEK